MATEKTAVRKLKTAAPTAQEDALTQADEYDSIFGTTPLELDDGDIIQVPPHPDYAMLPDDNMEAYDELMFAVDTLYDREPDIFIPEQTYEGLTMPAETKRGALKTPYRINNELVRPSHSVKVVQVALGEEGFAKLKAGGRNAADVWKIWGRQSISIKERQQRDTFRPAGSVDLAAVPPADS